MNIILDVAFVIAVTAFVKEQFGISGRGALVCAFVISLIVGAAPLLSAAIPAASAWIQLVVNTFALFLAAAGSYDAVKSFIAKKK
jgi:hypothetical protein